MEDRTVDKRMTELLREMEQMNLAEMADTELGLFHEQMKSWQARLDVLNSEVAWTRAERWWRKMPQEDVRTIRLLLKNTRLTPPLLQSYPELNHLLLLANVDDPDVVRLWASLTPEVRAKRIDELRRAVALTEHRRTTTSREDRTDSTLLAFDVLGLTPTAKWDDVRKAYRELATLHHPDKGGDPTLFNAVQKAYKLLEGRFL
ncbi:MAG: DnaJ domain-containing protein [Tumebacillaceae bacterium]